MVGQWEHTLGNGALVRIGVEVELSGVLGVGDLEHIELVVSLFHLLLPVIIVMILVVHQEGSVEQLWHE